jgi:hypothetical protein
MLHCGKMISGHSAPGRHVDRRPRIAGNDENSPAGRLIADIQIQIDDNSTAGLFAAVEFIVELPGWEVAIFYHIPDWPLI